MIQPLRQYCREHLLHGHGPASVVTGTGSFMHILMVAPQPFFRPRGTPFSVLHRIRALGRLGHTIELATYPFGTTPELPGVTIHRCARPPLVRDVPIGPSLPKLLLDGPLFRLAARLAATGRFDLLHTHEEAGWLGRRLRERHGLPHLYDMHSSLPQQLANFGRYGVRPVQWLFERLEQYTLAGADGVIAICPELHDHARRSGYTGPLATIENTLDFEMAEPTPAAVDALRRELQLDDADVVVYTGTLEAYQGLELLIEAAPLVHAARPRARFVLVGGTADRIAQLRAYASRAGAGELFRFVPAVEPAAVPRYHRLADVLVTTRSRGTNTPLKIYQYLRAGRPIVATAIRSHTQVLDDASAELVMPAADAIAAGIVRVLEEPDHAARIAHGAAALARDRYDEASYMRKLEELLAAVVRRGTAPLAA
jgi:glycosyltransferase involved in cell wall biosynthesis